MSARRGQARHAAPAGPGADDDRARSPLKVGDALRQRVRRRGQDAEPDMESPADVSYRQAGPPAASAYRPEPAPAPAYRPEPAPSYRPEPAPGSAYRPESAPSYRSEPAPAPAYRPEPVPSYRSEPAPAPAYRPEPAAPQTFRPAAPPTAETRETWLRRGQVQFDYLTGHGLQPGDRMLEIGCGTLSAGHLFIDYLSAGHYYGIDVSPDALLAAQKIIAEFRLQAKMPHLTLVSGFNLAFLPEARFTVVHAHNVFASAPIKVIGAGLAQVSRVMTRDAIFDLTFDRADGVEHQSSRRDFNRRADTLIGLADSHGFDSELMEDWEQFGHGHSKLRLLRRR